MSDGRAVERGDHADPAGQAGNGRLAGRVEQPLRVQASLELLEGELEGAQALRLHLLADDLILALGSYTLSRPRAMTRRPSSGLNFRDRVDERNITALSCAPGSFSVKYRWPVFHSRQFEISPTTQTSA